MERWIGSCREIRSNQGAAISESLTKSKEVGLEGMCAESAIQISSRLMQLTI
jgi:hypothetical protein